MNDDLKKIREAFVEFESKYPLTIDCKYFEIVDGIAYLMNSRGHALLIMPEEDFYELTLSDKEKMIKNIIK